MRGIACVALLLSLTVACATTTKYQPKPSPLAKITMQDSGVVLSVDDKKYPLGGLFLGGVDKVFPADTPEGKLAIDAGRYGHRAKASYITAWSFIGTAIGLAVAGAVVHGPSDLKRGLAFGGLGFEVLSLVPLIFSSHQSQRAATTLIDAVNTHNDAVWEAARADKR